MTAQLDFKPAELAELLKQKTQHSFAMLYDYYSAALFGHICKIVKDATVAEDLLQDTFVKIWRKIEMYDATRGTLFTWMLNIASHTCVDYLRSKHQANKHNKIDIDESGCENLHSPCVPEHSVAKTELVRFMQKLEIKYSQVIELTYLKGYTHQEVAVMLSLPLGTVKTRCRCGLRQLRLIYG